MKRIIAALSLVIVLFFSIMYSSADRWSNTAYAPLPEDSTAFAENESPDAPAPAAPATPRKRNTYVMHDKTGWVDSVMDKLSLEEKIGQLFMVSAFSARDKYNMPELERLVNDHKVGGIIFFKGYPARQLEMTNKLQSISATPLMVAIDGEWGLAMRLDSTVNYGYQMSIGASQDDSLPYKMGKEIALECQRMGIHVNFAPVVDINNNPLNPVIHMRSFGEDKESVTERSLMYMRGMQDQNVLAVAKHFPGHGNTSVDSHLDLPVLKQSEKEMDTLELYPFRQLFKAGVGGVMTAHLHIPAYDTTPNIAASLSQEVTNKLLRRKLKFKGLAFTDALNMQGVAKYFKPGELELKALLAGNDVLLCSEDVPKAIEVIKTAIDSGCLSREVLDMHVRRILEAKKWIGLDKCSYQKPEELTSYLNRPEAIMLKNEIAEDAITLVKNNDKLVPLKNLETYRIANVAIGTKVELPFQTMMKNYCRASYFPTSMYSSDAEWKKLRDTLKSYNMIIFSLHNLSNRKTSTYGLTDKAIDFINTMRPQQTSILVSMGSPYALDRFPDYGTVICAYQDDAAFQASAVEMLFGGIQGKGHLPVGVSASMPLNAGLTTPAPTRLKYGLPEEAGMSSAILSRIDKIADNAIKAGAMPGCQIVVAKKGIVVYQKSFGNLGFDLATPVRNSDLYDLASITKVASTTLAAMKLQEEGKISIQGELGVYLPKLARTNKADLQIREIMAHQAGLQAWIPFYKMTLNNNKKPDTLAYCNEPNDMFCLRVAENMYMNKSYLDTIYGVIDNSALDGRGHYRYSDLGFLYMQEVIEAITGKKLDKYMDSAYYRPLGLATMTYKPRECFPLACIVPTESDQYFRYQQIRGDVHDQAAAMLGGVAGHAGLFSDANDLAILLQMLLNDGSYGGRQYLKPSTIKLFTSRQFEDNRKGLGWDRPAENKNHSPASKYASDASFGHTGFTGTCVWADPESDLIYIFLSNRVNPTAENNKLVQMNVRTNIHDVIYESFIRKP